MEEEKKNLEEKPEEEPQVIEHEEEVAEETTEEDLSNTKKFEFSEEIKEKEEEVKAEKPKKEVNNKKILLVSLIALGVILIAGAVYYFLFREKPVEYTEYTLEMVSTDFTYEATGVIVTDDVASYSLEESETIQFLVGSYPAVEDLVEIDDVLFGYKETTFGDNIYKGVKPDTAGVVYAVTTDSVTVRDSVAATIDVPAIQYSPTVGTCAIMAISTGGTIRTVNGEVSQVLHGMAEDYVTLELIDPTSDLANGDTGEIKFASQALSDVYDCSELYVTQDGKIADTGDHGASDPAFEASNVLIAATTTTYSNEFPESEDPGNDYSLVSEDGLQVEVNDDVTTTTHLFRWTFVEESVENKTIKTLVRGEVKSVDLVKEDPDANTGTFNIEVYDLDKNYLVFDIGSEYEDLISVGSVAVITSGDTEITAEISKVEELVGSVANANFKNYELGDEFSVSIQGSGEDVLLIPKEYVKEGKVKLVIGEERKEVEITYEDYNEDNYKVTEGLSENDIVESYE
jgi:hypothetical protein